MYTQLHFPSSLHAAVITALLILADTETASGHIATW